VTVYWDLSKCALVMSTATARTVAVIATGGDTCAAPMPVPMMARTSVIHTRFVERAPVTPVAAFRVGGSWWERWERWALGPSGAVAVAFGSGGAGFGSGGGREKTFECLVPSQEDEGS